MNKLEYPTLSVGRDYHKDPHQNERDFIEIMQGNLCIGRVHCGMGQDEYELAQRVALIWAAAPELLESLVLMLDFQGSHEAMVANNIKARAAIAKATGAQS